MSPKYWYYVPNNNNKFNFSAKKKFTKIFSLITIFNFTLLEDKMKYNFLLRLNYD